MVWGSIPYEDSEFFFSLSRARDKTKNIFLYVFTELKTCHLCYSNSNTCIADNANNWYLDLGR